MTFFNIFYASLPIFCFGLFEKDIHEWIIDRNPKVYGDQKQLTFTTLVGWVGTGLVHSLIVFWGSWAIAGEIPINPNGQIGGQRVFGAYVLAVGYCVVLFKFVLETQHFVVWTWICLLIGCANFVSFELIQSYEGLILFPEYYHVWTTALGSDNVWLCMVVAVVGCLCFDVAVKYYNRQTYPSRWMILQEKYSNETELFKASLPADTRNTPLLVQRDTDSTEKS